MVARTAARALLASLTLLAVPWESALAHPLHMSFTEIRPVGSTKSLELSVRVFSDDFSIAAARFAGVRLGSDSIIDARSGIAYLVAHIRLDANGAAMRLVSCGVTRTPDMLQFCFRTALASPRKSVRISNRVLTEMFADQVNVVQSVTGNKRASRMFVRGDGWKAVP